MRHTNRIRLSRCLPLAATALLTIATSSPLFAQDKLPVLTSPAPASNKPVTATTLPLKVMYGGKQLTADSPLSAPYRDPADNSLCISPDMLTPLGVIYIVDEKMGKVTFTNAAGTATTTVELRTPPDGFTQKGYFVPALETVQGLGGKCEWDLAANTFYMRSVLQSIEVVNGKVIVQASLPMMPTVTRLSDEKKLIVEIVGGEVGLLPKTLPIDVPGVSQVRSGQFTDDVVHIVFDLKDNATSLQVETTKPSAVVAINPLVKSRPVGVDTGTSTRTAVARKPQSAPTTVSSVTFSSINENRAQFVVRAGRTPIARPNLTQGRLTVDLVDASLSHEVIAALGECHHPFLKAVQLIARGSSAAQLVLDLTRIVNFSIKPDINGNLILDIGLPRNAGGKLAGKLVVIDAGHGGQDSGAAGGGYKEKNVALGIALKLADVLRDNGANVLLTRADDFFIPVNERPRIANRANADFFIGVHADSGDSNHNLNGSTVYYHAYDQNCRGLAQCIAQQMETGSGMKSNGIRTDFVRFPGKPDGSTGGFGILRGARMVAVLVETGYMSNGHDVSLLVQSSTQLQIATAIATGLKAYIEGNPDLDTRSVRPGAGETLPPLDDVSNSSNSVPTAMPVISAMPVVTPMPMPPNRNR